MKKKITAVFVLFAFLMSGCGVVAKFEEAKDAYLEKRVAEMLVEDAEAETTHEDLIFMYGNLFKALEAGGDKEKSIMI